MAINPLAIGGGVVAAAAVVGGGLYAGGVFGGSDPKPQNTGNRTLVAPVSIEDAGEKGTYKDNFGAHYSYYLLSTQKKENDSEWKKKAALVTETSAAQTNGFFSNVTASSEENAKVTEIKKVCESKYKATEATGEETKWKEVWKFCSLFSEKPKAINEVTPSDPTYTGSVHGKTGETQLISVSGENNENFWNLQKKRYKKVSDKEVKAWCTEAYNKQSTEEGYNDETVYKYCSLEGSKKVVAAAA